MDSVLDTDDDEFVLEGSPLYEYLKEACPDDGFHSFQSNPSTASSANFPDSEDNSLIKQLIDVGKCIQWLGARISKGVVFPVERKQFTTYYNSQALPNYYSLALKSRSINEDDAAVLSTLLGVSGSKSKVSKLSQSKIILWLFFIGLLMPSHLMLISRIFHPSILWDGLEAVNISDTLISIIVMTTMFLSLTWQVSVLWQYIRLWMDHRQQKKSVSQFLTVHASFSDFLKKAVLYVQEVEVILRGYTMMTPFTPISHLERGSQTQLQCPALRQAIFQAARNQFMSLRQAMLTTLAAFPLRDEEQRDLNDVFLATTDLQHLADEFSILTDDSTGPYPTSYLKAISNLYSDQLSEFIRRHLLCLKSDLLADHTELTSSWHVALNSNRISAEKDLAAVKSSYDLHQPMTPPQSNNDTEVVTRGTQEIWGPSDVLPAATRALRLHLDVTVKSAMQLENRTHSGSDSKTNLGNSAMHDLEGLLSEVKDHLESCQTCIHEAETALRKLMGHVESVKSKEPVIKVEPVRSDVPSPQHLDFISPKDSDIDFIEEEVFEAYIDPERDDRIPDYSMDDLIEERRKKKQDSEDAKHMLMELHFVLSKREDEKEKMRRERRRIKEGGNAYQEGDSAGRMNEVVKVITTEREIDVLNDERTKDIWKNSIHVACDDSSNGTKSARNFGSSTGLNAGQINALKENEDSNRTGIEANCKSIINSSNGKHNFMPEERILVTENGGAELFKYPANGDPSSHPMSMSSCADISSSSICEGFDASGVGNSTETVIRRRPVPKPRKNIGPKLHPARDMAVPSNKSDANVGALENDKSSSVLADLDCLKSIKRQNIDSGSGSGSDDDDIEGACHWRPQPMAMPFMQGLAAEAARMSRERQSLAEDTFGD